MCRPVAHRGFEHLETIESVEFRSRMIESRDCLLAVEDLQLF